MYLDLMDVLREPGSTVTRPVHIAPTTLDDVEIVAPVEGVVRATNARQSIVVDGEAGAVVKLTCARCLSSYAQRLELALEAVAPLSFFRAQLNGEAVADQDDEPDDELAAIFDAHSVDVLELIRQAVVLQSPLQPLCRPDCPGLPEASLYAVAPPDERWNILENWQDSNGKEQSHGPP